MRSGQSSTRVPMPITRHSETCIRIEAKKGRCSQPSFCAKPPVSLQRHTEMNLQIFRMTSRTAARVFTLSRLIGDRRLPIGSQRKKQPPCGNVLSRLTRFSKPTKSCIYRVSNPVRCITISMKCLLTSALQISSKHGNYSRKPSIPLR